MEFPRKFKVSKLVRDKIPENIQKLGGRPKSYSLAPQKLVSHLRLKLQEETKETLEAETKEQLLEECADILEVLHALAKSYELTLEDIEKKRLEKQVKRGGYDQGIFLELIEVDDQEDSHPVIQYCLTHPEKYPEI